MDLYQFVVQHETTRSDTIYSYPVDEKATNATESKADAKKLSREQKIIEHSTPNDWSAGVDFGCGVGRYFELLCELSRKKDKILLGVEPDPRRASVAHSTVDNFDSCDIVVACNTADLLLSASEHLGIDFFLAAQVIGHTTHSETDKIMNTALNLHKNGASIILLMPFVNAYNTSPTGEDFCHVVDFNAASDSSEFRTRITAPEFDELARAPYRGQLPVRAFSTAVPADLSLTSLPKEIPHAPPYITKFFPNAEALIYSIHEFGNNGIPFIGDLAIRVS